MHNDRTVTETRKGTAALHSLVRPATWQAGPAFLDTRDTSNLYLSTSRILWYASDLVRSLDVLTAASPAHATVLSCQKVMSHRLAAGLNVILFKFQISDDGWRQALLYEWRGNTFIVYPPGEVSNFRHGVYLRAMTVQACHCSQIYTTSIVHMPQSAPSIHQESSDISLVANNCPTPPETAPARAHLRFDTAHS